PVIRATLPSNRMSLMGVGSSLVRSGCGSLGVAGSIRESSGPNHREPPAPREPPAGRPGGSGPTHLLEGGADLLSLLAVDLAQLVDRRFGDVVAGDALGLALELAEVDPGLVQMAGALGDDAAVQQRLDQHAEDVGVLLHHPAPVLVTEGFHHRRADVLPVEPELRVDRLLLLRVDQVHEDRVEARGRPRLDLLVLLLAELGHGAPGPDASELV